MFQPDHLPGNLLGKKYRTFQIYIHHPVITLLSHIKNIIPLKRSHSCIINQNIDPSISFKDI